MRLIHDHVLRTINGTCVLVPLSDSETDFHGMVALNHTAEALCRMLEVETDREQLISGLAEAYDVVPEQIAGDVDSFLSELEACHLLIC